MERIRVVHIVPTLDQSGAEKQLCLLACNLPRARFETHVLAITRGGHYEGVLRDAGVNVEVIGKRFKWDPTTLARLARRLKTLQPDIVQTWLFAGNTYGRMAALWANCPRIIASERCVDSWKQQYQFVIDRWLARRTTALVVNSQAVRAFYAHVGIDPSTITVIPNAVAAAVHSNSDEARAGLRSGLGLPEGRPIVGFVGRLWPQKRVQDLIWGADILRAGGWEFSLLIVGDGPRRSALERLCRSLDFSKYVHFLGHRIDARSLIDIMDVVVIPSRFEGMPNVALEAMQAGKPVVATRIAGMDEVVVDGVTGLLVPPKRPMEIARALSKLLNDAPLCQMLGTNGRERIEREFSVGAMVARYVEMYDAVMAGHSPVDPIRESERINAGEGH